MQHTHPLMDCHVSMETDGSLRMELDRAVRALAPGQYAVLYDGEMCLGSAQITSVGPTMYDLFRNGISMAQRHGATSLGHRIFIF